MAERATTTQPPSPWYRRPPCLCNMAATALLAAALISLLASALPLATLLLAAALISNLSSLELERRRRSKPARLSAAPTTIIHRPPPSHGELLADIPDLLWLIEGSNRIITPLNASKLGNHPSGNGEKDRLSAILPSRAARLYLEALIALHSDNTPQRFEYQLGQNDGEQSTFEARLIPLANNRCLALIRDISHIKAMEEALFHQQLFVHQIIDASPALVFVRDRHGRFLLVNRATQNSLGHELLVQSHMAWMDPDRPFATGDDEVLEEQRTIRLLDQWTLPNGQVHWFDVTKQPLVRDDETYILNIAIDITHLKAAETALASGDSLLHAVADALPHPFLLIEEGMVEFANYAACDLLGMTPNELIGEPLDRLASNADRLISGETGAASLERSNAPSIPCAIHPVERASRPAHLIVLGG
ncbi:PAS domain-containing protein [Chitinilyticum aquatile]|uniref:PAS domain-containing protein n=1 Tax=Chitinilyticum aquatile TaxID=362520 RepID=UPI0009D6DE05|nr:PAS domain-containing protein [Chitinilyticum aquatile]